MRFSGNSTNNRFSPSEGAMELLGYGSINFVHAAGRRDDFRREAERDRQIAAARAAAIAGQPDGAVRAALRRAVGGQLIRLGERVRGPRPDWTGGAGRCAAAAAR